MALNELEPDSLLRVLATDPGSVRDFEVFSRQSGNALLILISGDGDRVAESFDGDAAGAPLLHVENTVP